MEILEYDFPTPNISQGQLAGNNVTWQQKMFCSLSSSTTILIRRKAGM